MTDLAGCCDDDDLSDLTCEVGNDISLEQADYDDTQGPHVRIIEANDIVTAIRLSRDGT